MLIILKAHVGGFQPAQLLDVDLIKAVDQDIGDIGIGQQRLQGTQAQNLEFQFPGQTGLFPDIERLLLFFQEHAQGLTDFFGSQGFIQLFQLAQIETLQEEVMDALFNCVETASRPSSWGLEITTSSPLLGVLPWAAGPFGALLSDLLYPNQFIAPHPL